MRPIESSFVDYVVHVLAPTTDRLAFLPTAANRLATTDVPRQPVVRQRWRRPLDGWLARRRQRVFAHRVAEGAVVGETRHRADDFASRYY